MAKLFYGNKAVSPVIGTILMVAITVIMAAIIGGFVYQTSRPKIAPNLAATLEDDQGRNQDGLLYEPPLSARYRIATLTIEDSRNIAKSELVAIATYTSTSTEFTAYQDGADWVTRTSFPFAELVNDGAAMGTDRIHLYFVDADGSGDITPGDRLDFRNSEDGGGAVDPGQYVSPNTDFTVKIVHKSTEVTLVNQTVRVY